MRRYPSKLILFGEYVLLLGARALATPVPIYYGQWEQDDGPETVKLREQLIAFVQSPEVQSLAGLERDRLQQDLNNYLYFNSNIPVGYGLGSSGALTAGLYDRYVAEKSTGPERTKKPVCRP